MATKMGPRTAEAWALRMAGKSYNEIADIMGVARKGVGSYVACARAHLAGTKRPTGRPAGQAVHRAVPIDPTARCPRCHLRGEHECLPTSAAGTGRGNTSNLGEVQ